MAPAEKVKGLKVKEKAAKKLFKALKVKGYGLWKAAKLETALNQIEKYVDGADDLEGDSLTLLKQVSEVLEAGGKVKVIPSPDSGTETEDEPKAKKAPKEKSERKPGVIDAIIEVLTNASAKKPVTKEEIVEALTEKFPDRDPEKMTKTVNTQVPGRLKDAKGLDVRKEGKGFWINSK